MRESPLWLAPNTGSARPRGYAWTGWCQRGDLTRWDPLAAGPRASQAATRASAGSMVVRAEEPPERFAADRSRQLVRLT